MTDTAKKTILVTGGAGFIGSNLIERLVKDPNNRVISLDNYFTGSKENHIGGATYIEGHTKDIEKLIDETPDIIYHLGEYSRVEQSILEPDLVYDLNTIGTQAVVEFWRKKRCKLVYAGSSTKFGDNGLTRTASPYASTKAENSELVCRVGVQEAISYAVAYFYNVYGPRERSGAYGTVIEHFKQMYISGAPCAIVSPGTQVRNFTHVNDIVDGLIAVGENGAGDGYGLGNERAYSILDVAEMFGFDAEDIVMFPEREGNRMISTIDISRIQALGWTAQKALSQYIQDFTSTHTRGEKRGKRILVFSTTMHPIAGLAEDAFVETARALPSVQFDVVTTKFVRGLPDEMLAPNITILRRGVGIIYDKYLLLILGVITGFKLMSRNSYLFTWSLMASYATLAAVFLKTLRKTPLLVTLADHNVDDVPGFYRMLLRLMIANADQVYGTHKKQEMEAVRAISGALPRNSLGGGDAFANALRYAYADIVRKKQEQS